MDRVNWIGSKWSGRVGKMDRIGSAAGLDQGLPGSRQHDRDDRGDDRGDAEKSDRGDWSLIGEKLAIAEKLDREKTRSQPRKLIGVAEVVAENGVRGGVRAQPRSLPRTGPRLAEIAVEDCSEVGREADPRTLISDPGIAEIVVRDLSEFAEIGVRDLSEYCSRRELDLKNEEQRRTATKTPFFQLKTLVSASPVGGLGFEPHSLQCEVPTFTAPTSSAHDLSRVYAVSSVEMPLWSALRALHIGGGCRFSPFGSHRFFSPFMEVKAVTHAMWAVNN
ncbi:hypothetical protein LXL04_002901 [Taraxacum kok-saghyz]